ncbi:hypothetical protein [Frankia sp. AgB32]|uniref:hypothetical protein n=1 Tax=Frankia sp. AgB32 TaxID=631119 RepID=UPI00200DCA8D|nr:hypothetical protein [Frankia sp. AgB32]MCK9894548.1 hypothetical protein [Frankia sp. AgB32]
MDTRRTSVPPRPSWAPPVGPFAIHVTDAPPARDGRRDEPLARLDRALARMEALMTLLEEDLRRQRELLGALAPQPRQPAATDRPAAPVATGGAR